MRRTIFIDQIGVFIDKFGVVIHAAALGARDRVGTFGLRGCSNRNPNCWFRDRVREAPASAFSGRIHLRSETIITCAVTGGAPIAPGAANPITPEQIADECLAAAEAGAAIVHIHVRDPSTGKPSMESDLYAQTVSRIRSRNADLIINLTTGPGSRFVPDAADPKRGGPGTSLAQPAARVEHVLALRPEICSLDIATMNLGASPIINTPPHNRAMAKLIQDAGVKPELEVFELGHLEQAKALVAEGFVSGTPFIQICLGAPGGAPALPRTMLGMRDSLPADCVWSAFGFGAQSFPMVAQAFLLGGHVRVGLEDNIYIKEGKLAAGNAELVEHAHRIVHDLGGTVASAQTARRQLGLA